MADRGVPFDLDPNGYAISYVRPNGTIYCPGARKQGFASRADALAHCDAMRAEHGEDKIGPRWAYRCVRGRGQRKVYAEHWHVTSKQPREQTDERPPG